METPTVLVIMSPEVRSFEPMEWTTPQFEEVCLNCEINTYASASL